MTRRDAALAFFVVSVWGFGFTLAKPAVSHFPPVFLTLLSFLITGIVLTIVERRPAKTPHWRAALIALFAISAQTALIFTGLVGLEASTAVLAAQAQVPMAVLWSWAFRTESFQMRTLAALAIALAGVAVIAGLPENPPALLPLMTLLAGGLAWGLGQVLTGRLSSDDGIVLLRQVTYHAIPQLALASFVFESGQIQSVMTASLPIWAAAGFIAIGSYTLCYIIWFSLLMRNPVSAVTPFVFFMPAISVTASVLILGEKPGPFILFGGGLILVGVALATGLIRFGRPQAV
jgi:O-acetylserine/cysteine efflux transporter